MHEKPWLIYRIRVWNIKKLRTLRRPSLFLHAKKWNRLAFLMHLLCIYCASTVHLLCIYCANVALLAVYKIGAKDEHLLSKTDTLGV